MLHMRPEWYSFRCATLLMSRSKAKVISIFRCIKACIACKWKSIQTIHVALESNGMQNIFTVTLKLSNETRVLNTFQVIVLLCWVRLVWYHCVFSYSYSCAHRKSAWSISFRVSSVSEVVLFSLLRTSFNSIHFTSFIPPPSFNNSPF